MLRKKCLMVGTLCLVLLGITSLPSSADQLDDAYQAQRDLSTQRSQAQGKLGQLIYREDVIKAELADMEKRIESAQINLNKTQVALNRAQEEVEIAHKNVELKQAELESRQEVMGKRAKAIYEEGQVSYLEMLFRASSFSDFIMRVEYFSMLVENDRSLLQDILIQKEQLSHLEEELQNKRDVAAQLEAQAVSAKKGLDQARAQRVVALDQNRRDQLAEIENIQRMEAEANALNEKIRKMQEIRNDSGSGAVTTWPLNGRYTITSRFGWRVHPVQRTQSFHTGVDIAASSGTAIAAAGDGVVLIAAWNDAYGNMVIIDHGKGISTLYGHQSSMKVKESETVKAGQTIGNVGSTGWSTGPHLHFEIRENGNATDPLRYFSF